MRGAETEKQNTNRSNNEIFHKFEGLNRASYSDVLSKINRMRVDVELSRLKCGDA